PGAAQAARPGRPRRAAVHQRRRTGARGPPRRGLRTRPRHADPAGARRRHRPVAAHPAGTPGPRVGRGRGVVRAHTQPRRRVPRPHRPTPSRPERQAEGDRPMSPLAYAVRDSRTMLRRNLLRMLRYPSMTLVGIAIPAVFLLLFVYVFGGAIGA